MGRIESHRDLKAWQMAYAFGISIYKATKFLPDSERFGLSSQMRRGAVSVPSNIAEGYGRGSTADYGRFLRVARGALFELDTQAQFCRDLQFFSESIYSSLYEEWTGVSKVLAGLIRAIEPNA